MTKLPEIIRPAAPPPYVLLSHERAFIQATRLRTWAVEVHIGSPNTGITLSLDELREFVACCEELCDDVPD